MCVCVCVCVPARRFGGHTVRFELEVGGQTSVLSADTFTYDGPVVSSFASEDDKGHYPTEGGVTILVRGENFGSPSVERVLCINGRCYEGSCNSTAPTVNVHEELRCDLPSGYGSGLAFEVRIASL